MRCTAYTEFIFFGLPDRIEPLDRASYIGPPDTEVQMLDAIFLATGLAFFAGAIGYTLICEKL